MSRQDAGFLAARILAIYCWIQCIGFLSSALWFSFALWSSPGHFQFWSQFLFQSLVPIGYLIAGTYLWKRTDVIAKRLVPSDAEATAPDSSPSIPLGSYELAFATIGLFLLVTGIPHFAGGVASLATIHMVGQEMTRSAESHAIAGVVDGLIQACAGYVVLIKTADISRTVATRSTDQPA